jgi:hypothetical protein
MASERGGLTWDSAGNAAVYRPLSALRPGDEVLGGWKPWATVERVEVEGERARVYYTTHGPTDWFPLSTPFPIAARSGGVRDA